MDAIDWGVAPDGWTLPWPPPEPPNWGLWQRYYNVFGWPKFVVVQDGEEDRDKDEEEDMGKDEEEDMGKDEEEDMGEKKEVDEEEKKQEEKKEVDEEEKEEE